MKLGRLNHVSVTTANVDRSLRFYEDLLGLPLRGRGETSASHLPAIIGFRKVRLRWAELELGAGQLLELFEYLVPAGHPLTQRTCDPGSVHLAFEVDDISALHERLTEAAVITRSAPIEIKTGDWRGARSLYALDPDGVTVELVQLPLRESDAGNSGHEERRRGDL